MCPPKKDEEAAREERLQSELERLASVAGALGLIIETFPEVTEEEAVKIRSKAILALEEIRSTLVIL